MKDLQKLVGSLNKSGALSGFLGGVAGGGLTSLATSKSGRKTGKKALKYGALAAVGGLAWKAYKQYSDKNQQGFQQGHGQQSATPHSHTAQPALTQDTYTPDPRRTSPQPQTFEYAPAKLQQSSFEQVVEDDSGNGQLILMRAMIAAAYADGHIDENERQTIFTQVENMALSVQEKAMLFDELRKPMSLNELVAAVPDAQTGIEVYAASASAIDLSAPVSGQYLNSLANQLCLPSELVSSIHQQLASA